MFLLCLGKSLAANVRRHAGGLQAAEIPRITPRELRHTGISLMSLAGLQNEEITRIAGHAITRTLELIYRDEFRPVITTGANAMDSLLSRVPTGR